MKRFALKLILFLLLGAIINVAVAWGFALWASPISYPGVKHYVMLSNMDAEHFLKDRFSEIGSIDRAQFGAIQTMAMGRTETEYGMRPNGDRYIIKKDFGIPQRSMSMELGDSYEQLQPSWYLSVPHWIPYVQFPGHVPLRPIWLGFAINTIFYAAILWLPFAALGTFRRRRRIKRGLCPKCGYDLRGSQKDFCPECGAATTISDSRKPTAESPQ